MKDEIERDTWTEYFKEFSRRNQGRPTKLEILGDLGAQREEQHLPLAGIGVEDTGKDAPRIEIMLGGGSAGASHLTHTITRVTGVLQKLDNAGREEAIEIEDDGGTKTILVFEALTELKAAS